MYPFLLLNIAIMASYFLTLFILNLPYLKMRLNYSHKLKLARFNFILSALVFICMPYCKRWHAIDATNYEIKPMFYQTSLLLSHSQVLVTKQLQNTNHMPGQFSLGTILFCGFFIGVIWHLIKYARTLLKLKKLQHNAFCLHKIRATAILFIEAVTPFCWSWFNKHLIILPISLLEHSSDKRLAIRHELQHIRQNDTYWLHLFNVLTLFCYFNPFLSLWKKYLNELQEFACDEALILRKHTSPTHYAQCLVNAAKQKRLVIEGSAALHGISQSLLYRRINMLFQYKTQKGKFTLIAAHALCLVGLTSAAFAINNSSPVTTSEVQTVIEQAKLNTAMPISATPEVVNEINRIRTSVKGREYMLGGLKRMQEYQPYIQEQLKNKNMPTDLLAMPLLQSSYKPLDASQNRVAAAGIWQIIPVTAKRLGLIVNNHRDDRLNTQLSTQAALAYLNTLHDQFNDWKLAVIGYEIGEKATAQLIKDTNSRDPWTLARSQAAPKELKDYLAMYDAAVIIMHKPSLITG